MQGWRTAISGIPGRDVFSDVCSVTETNKILVILKLRKYTDISMRDPFPES